IFFGVGAVPGAAAGAGIGLQVGNLILLALGLSSIAEYFYQGLPACLSAFQEGFATAWHADEGLKPEGLDPTGGSAYVIQERIDRAAQQIAKGQEQLVLLLFTAIVTYMTRGQVKAGLMGSMDSIAARSAKLQSEISNKQFANWLARNEQKLLAQPELRVNEPAPFKKAQDPQPDAQGKKPESPPKVEKIERHELGDIIGTYSALDPGPLPPDIAATFTGGRYTVVKLERDTVLNRVGTAEQELGQFFSRYTPDGVIQSRIDRAILPEWPTGGKSPIDTVFNVKIPAGTEVYIGEIGSQGGFYVGGAEQIVVIKPWTIKGIEVMSSGPLK
ncbi:DUF6861 domain-containing protein, partial [Pseudomonas syringae]